MKRETGAIWFLTGSQHLYGEATLQKVAEHSQAIVSGLAPKLSLKLEYQPVVTTPDEIYQVCSRAAADPSCAGVIAWMHTFSPAKMWIRGLKALRKPLLHLHTQFNRDIPWAAIDMDFMNLNQSAHGDREFGFIMSRMMLERKVVTGHRQDPAIVSSVDAWCRAAAGWHDWQGARFVRFGDNMRQVAVTEGDKVEAEMQLGYSVNTHGVGDLVEFIGKVKNDEIDHLCDDYSKSYTLAKGLERGGARHASLREAARIEMGMRTFLEAGNYKGFTDTFEDLHGLRQLPGMATQRLMAEGYGFGAEGDWKTAALVRAMKVMAEGLPGGNSFMEDYTYHFDPADPMVLGAHMLEICPSIASDKPSCEVHPLGIGGKEDPVRLVFNAKAGRALNASVVAMGSRFRLLINEVTAVDAPQELPKLPVARVLWKPHPDMNTACSAWILSGGAHHTCFSQNLSAEHLRDFARMAGMECVVIGGGSSTEDIRRELQWNHAYYHMKHFA